MRILVLSDSHSKKLKINEKYDYIIHAGDYGDSIDYILNNNIYFCKGNCDTLGEKELIFNIDKYKIFLTHGDLYNVKYNYNSLYFKALSINCNIVIFGHTHYQEVFKENNIFFINPGSYRDNNYIEIIDNIIYLYQNNKLINKINL